MNLLLRSRLRPTPSRTSRSLPCSSRKRRLPTGLAVLAVGLLLTLSPRPAAADPVRIFLAQGGGTSQEVTSSYSYQQHHVYDALGNLAGTVDTSGYVHNTSGQTIGYVILIYRYDAGGIPAEVTASCHYQQHHVYDLLGNLIGTVDSAGTIRDANNQIIGYMTFVPAD